MDTGKDDSTYIISERLGRGHELSDEEFEWFYHGKHGRFSASRLREVSAIVNSVPWLKEVAAWKALEDRPAPELTGLKAKLEVAIKPTAALPD